MTALHLKMTWIVLILGALYAWRVWWLSAGYAAGFHDGRLSEAGHLDDAEGIIECPCRFCRTDADPGLAGREKEDQ